ncbi:leishmanolysin-related zinc metalloendopeptidase [Tsuneonella mangrovi]|uniref:leishmanolysin-related zinc metalloendopeptidase n=1 Tax=Tsuneonella mangrovi TaxID=1982042 RepID=UPI0012370E09|nr:leishmanolysin-related zinc metalloendopeptidase [Tsuneonella mangrovi]
MSAAKGGNGGGGGKPGGGGGGGGGGGYTPPASYTSGADGAYNITIEFTGDGWTQELVNIFERAADFYSQLIAGDVADVKVIGAGKPRTVDDIVIQAEITAIDGTGGILGQAGPTSVRTQGSLPATAIMQFDVADANDFNALGLFDDIVFHEMGHSLGFGSIWDMLGLVDTNNLFTGTLAKAQSNIQFGTTKIYVETDGGSGTAGSHWDEATYGNEIMTGYINNVDYLSHMTAASYGDLGYELAADYLSVADGQALEIVL